MKMISSYVMQDDQLFPMLTVQETFMFAAEMRLPPSISRAEKKKRVNELLSQLGLEVKSPTRPFTTHNKRKKIERNSDIKSIFFLIVLLQVSIFVFNFNIFILKKLN